MVSTDYDVQNRQITKKIKEIKEEQSTDDQKNYYKKKIMNL